MRELIFDFAVRETDTGDKSIRDVDDGSDLHLDIFAFLMILSLRLSHLALVATDEQSGDMMRVWELPSVLPRR